MTRSEALEKLISVRHHCFVRGVLQKNPDSGFALAFRDVNRLYVNLRDGSARQVAAPSPAPAAAGGKSKLGRPTVNGHAMTTAERVKLHRRRKTSDHHHAGQM